MTHPFCSYPFTPQVWLFTDYLWNKRRYILSCYEILKYYYSLEPSSVMITPVERVPFKIVTWSILLLKTYLFNFSVSRRIMHRLLVNIDAIWTWTSKWYVVVFFFPYFQPSSHLLWKRGLLSEERSRLSWNVVIDGAHLNVIFWQIHFGYGN